MGVLELVDQCIGLLEIDEAMEDSAAVTDGVMKKSVEVRQWWADYFNSFDHSEAREHTLKSGYVERPGDYVRGLRIRYSKTAEGLTKGTVTATDYKSEWIEYGSSRMPAFSPRRATIAHFGGSDKAVSA